MTAPHADAQVKLEVSLPQLPVELPQVELELQPVLDPITDALPLPRP